MNNDYIDIIKTALHIKIINLINADLVIGRIDNNLQPYTDQEIDVFINNNNENIDEMIEQIIRVYEYNNALYELENPTNECIRDFLYYFVRCIPYENYEYEQFNFNRFIEN